MRLWHYELLPALPDKWIQSQWRECISIKRKWENNSPESRLIIYVRDYDKAYFYKYFLLVLEEMIKRGIKYNFRYVNEISDFCGVNEADLRYRYDSDIHYTEHNKRYLIQCYYNLQEKYDRGIISKDDWNRIKEFVNINYIVMNKKNYYEIDGDL